MKLDTDYLKSELKKQVSEQRYIHSIGVAKTAKELAIKYGEDPYKAKVAGILHDYTKYWQKEKMAAVIKENCVLSDDLLQYNAELWHGPTASIVIQEKFQIKDQQIIDAIRYHTSGRENMSMLEKVVCLADYIEPSRDFPGVDEIRDLANKELDTALLAAFNSTIQFLLDKKLTIYPLTILARNYLITEEKNKK